MGATKEQYDIITAIKRTCHGDLSPEIRAQVVEMLQEGKHDEARMFDVANRPGCGYNFNDTIIAGPLDGQVHNYTCPDCGVKGTYRAPWFDKPPEDPDKHLRDSLDPGPYTPHPVAG